MRKSARKRFRVNDGEKECFRNRREMSGAGEKAGETFAVGVADECRGKNGRKVREFIAFLKPEGKRLGFTGGDVGNRRNDAVNRRDGVRQRNRFCRPKAPAVNGKMVNARCQIPADHEFDPRGPVPGDGFAVHNGVQHCKGGGQCFDGLKGKRLA